MDEIRKHYVHTYEYELDKIKELENKLKKAKFDFVKKYQSIKLDE